MFKKSFILSFSLLFFITNISFASNIGRKFYGVYAESLTGVDFSANINDNTVRLYTWGNFSTSDGTNNPKEGLKYLKCSVSNSSWGGGGITFANSSGAMQRDMSAYYGGELRFSVRINSANCAKFPIGINVDGIDICIPLSNFSGFSSSKLNQWQDVSIKLNSTTNANITSSNMANTKYLFLISYGENVVSNSDVLEIDYIRWVKPNSSGTFDVKVKKVSDNSTVSTSNITWAASNFQTDWKVAEQYLEIDYDDDSKKNWNVKLFVNNGSSDRNGLYAIKGGREFVLPMCWRASEKTLPYNDNNGAHTTQIAEGYNTSGKYYYLYDSGSSSTDYSPWLYMQDLKALKTDKDKDYSTVMDYKTGGYHAYSGTYGSGSGSNGYYSGSKVSLYLGANCKNAVGGLRYTGNICVVFEYE